MVQVKALMRKTVVTVSPENTISEVARKFANNRVGSAVILKGKKPVGIITREDVINVVAHGKNINTVKVSELKQQKFVTAKPTDDLLAVVRTMSEEGVKRVPIIDKGKIVGILTEKEILSAVPEMIEILNKKLKSRISEVSEPGESISGICEDCEDFSDDLRHTVDGWLCEDCRSEENEISEKEDY